MKLIDKDKLLDDIHSHYEANNPEQNRIMDECAMIVIKSRTVDTSDVCVAVLQAMMDEWKHGTMDW